MLSGNTQPKTLVPPDITPDHVLGLAEVLYSLGGSIDPMYVGDAVGESIRILPHAIDLAEALDIIKHSGGVITLTEFGRKIVVGDNEVVRRLLRETALKLEPLREIIERLKSKGFISVKEYDKIIKENYPTDYEKAFKNILIWGAFLKIFRMNKEGGLILPIHIRDL